MPKTRSQKQDDLKKLTDQLGRMKSVVLATSSGVKVSDVTMLRRQMRSETAEYVVIKKTLLARALKDAGIDYPGLADLKEGIALAFGFADEVAPAKLLSDFRKDHETVNFLGGIVGGTVYSAAEVQALAKLPSRQELLAKLVGSLAAPLSGFVRVAAGPLRGFLTVLDAKAKTVT